MSDPYSERLSEYLDGELEAAERAALEAHLTECPTCRAELEGLRRTIDRLEAAADREPGEDLWPGIHARLEPRTPAEAVSRSRRRPLLAVAASLAALAMGAGIVFWAAQRAVDPQPTMARRPATTTEPSDAPMNDAAVNDVPVNDSAVSAYRQAVAEWHGALDEARWPAEVDAELRAQTEAFDRAVEETMAALRDDPNDQDLRAYLVEMLQAQMRFLSRVGPAAQEVS